MNAGRARDRETHVIDFRGPFVLQRLAGGWTAIYRMAPQGSDVIVSEMRLIPTASPDDDGRPSVPPGGLPSRVVRDARPGVALGLFKARLTATLSPGGTGQRAAEGAHTLRAIGQLQAALFPETASMTLREFEALGPSQSEASLTPERVSAARESIADWQKLVEDRAKQRWGPWGHAFDRTRKTPADRSDRPLRLARTAALYVDALTGGEAAPVKWVAGSMGRNTSQVRSDIHDARLAGLLTPAPAQGRSGGVLTPAAIAILEEADARWAQVR